MKNAQPVQRFLARLTCLAVFAVVAQANADEDDEDDEAQAKFDAISTTETMVMVPMRDDVRLATDVYLPKEGDGPWPAVFVKTPYNVNKIEGVQLEWGIEAVERGYAYVVQNERGRYYSEGEWDILGRPRTDGYDSLSWIAEQTWSDGNVGTLGCSSSAEWQLALAAENHPAHKAMVPMAAGAGIGRVGEFHEQGNWYKGGVHQTLFSIWLYSVQQDIRPRFPDELSQEQLKSLRKMYDLAAEMPEIDWKKHVKTLPAVDWLESAGANAGPGAALMARKSGDRAWYEGGLYHDDQDFGVPAFWFNSWFDVSQGPNLALFNHVRHNASDPDVREGQYVLIAPTLHCGFYRIPEHKDLIVGELNVGDANFALYEQLFGFLDYYLKGGTNGFDGATPRVQYYTMGRNEWGSSAQWPPETAETSVWYVASDGAANSVFGNGRLGTGPPDGAASDTFTYDPMNPVPALGGGVCCNQDAAPGGSFDQRGIEARADVLVYTSELLEQAMEVTGSVRATLFVSSDARDTDFTVKLVDVYPDGTAYNVDDTMRNLNTGGNNYDETEPVVAQNTVHHSENYPTRIVLPVVPKVGEEQ